MSLTVRELIAIPTLRTRVVAGGSGLDRQISWAHSCELPEPWNWMGSGDLLMTVGHGMPPGEAEQIHYLSKLAEADLAGIALAEAMFAPELTAGARDAADALAFPILETGYQIPFVTLARAVADSNERESHFRLARVLRMYDTFRRAIAGGQREHDVFHSIESDVGAPIYAIDVLDGTVALSSARPLTDAALSEMLRYLGEREGRLPAVMRLTAGGERFVLQPLSNGKRWVLATAVDDHVVDLSVLEHVATIVLVQLERQRSADLARLHAGGRLLTHLMQGRVDPELAAAQLSELGLTGPPWRVSMTWDRDNVDLIRVQRRLRSAGEPHVLDKAADRIIVLTDESVDASAIAAAATGDAPGLVGVSDAVNSLSRLPEAIREARWSLEAAGSAITGTATNSSMFLPRSVSEGEAAVTRVLGPLLDYDTEHSTKLVESLEVFFGAQRSWQEAAKQLCVHKQTLIYRMRRVEQITGRRLDHLDDIAELHLALRTRSLLRTD
jgi:purine catabolism regulator